MKTNKMNCPDCGVEMNHHADKIDSSGDVPEEIDAGQGGTVVEAHVCPKCGKTVMRRKLLAANHAGRRMIRRSSFAYNGIL